MVSSDLYFHFDLLSFFVCLRDETVLRVLAWVDVRRVLKILESLSMAFTANGKRQK